MCRLPGRNVRQHLWNSRLCITSHPHCIKRDQAATPSLSSPSQPSQDSRYPHRLHLPRRTSTLRRTASRFCSILSTRYSNSHVRLPGLWRSRRILVWTGSVDLHLDFSTTQPPQLFLPGTAPPSHHTIHHQLYLSLCPQQSSHLASSAQLRDPPPGSQSGLRAINTKQLDSHVSQSDSLFCETLSRFFKLYPRPTSRTSFSPTVDGFKET